MYCMILQPWVPCMSGAALGYWHVYKTASLETYWFVYFAASFRLHLAHWSAGTESKWHVSVTPSPTNQDPLSVLLLIGRVCTPGCEFLRAEAAQETGGGGMSVGVISMLLGPAELSGFAWFMWEILYRLGLKAAGGGVEGGDAERDCHYETAVLLLALWANAHLLICSLCCTSCCKLDVLAVQHQSFVRVHKLTRCELINAGSDLIEESDLMAK